MFRVLIIDDEKNFTSGVAEWLTDYEVTAIPACTFEEALSSIQGPELIDIVLFDGILDEGRLSLPLIPIVRQCFPNCLLVAMSNSLGIRDQQMGLGCTHQINKDDACQFVLEQKIKC